MPVHARHARTPRGPSRRALVRSLAALVAALVSACSNVQTTEPGVVGVDREQRMSALVSEEELEQGARAAYAQILGEAKKKNALNTDPRMLSRVRRIAGELIPEVGVFRRDARGWNWEVNVIDSEQLNAWAMPGGKIAFYSGIIEKLELSDAEIAAIMGHEIAHALREHSRERASEQALANLGLLGGVVISSIVGVDPSTWARPAQLAYQLSVGLPHSRLHETEADRIGVELAARAGYDPRAAISVWQKMARANAGKGGPEFLSTHPSPETRITDLQRYSRKVMPLYRQAS